MSSLTDNCDLILYYQDKRISKNDWLEKTKLSLSKQTAKRANDTISGYFQLENKYDKKLFESIFSSDAELNWFEFNRKEAPDITCGIKILGNRNIVFVDSPEIFEALDKKERKVHVVVKGVFGENEYDLSLKDLRGERRNELSIIALYNSESFIKHNQCSTNIGFSRCLEVIEPQEIVHKL